MTTAALRDDGGGTGAGDLALRRRQQRGWMVYDWANSGYATTTIAVFLGPYLTSVARAAACGTADAGGTGGTACPADARLHVLGVAVSPGSYYSYLLALSIVVQVVILPVTGAIADRSRRKRSMLALCAYVGATAATLMVLVEGGRWLLGGVLYLVANAGFGASVVVYNSFLPEISEPDERDRVSSRGWALGYLGGGLLLAGDLAVFSARGALGLDTDEAVRACLVSAGVWWAVFTLVPLRRLPADDRELRGRREGRVLTAGFAQLRTTLREMRGTPQVLLFLAAYLVYNDGIQSAIGLASVYGVEELLLPQSTMIVAILLVQFVAFGGALLLGRLAHRLGAKRVVLAALVLWALTVGAGYGLEERATAQFLGLAAAIGVVLGGSQALSRSLFSQMIPPGREAAYFGVYEVSERGTSWLGAVTFGVVHQLTGSYRLALVSLVAFFVLGGLLLAGVDVRRAVAEAGNAQPARL